MPRSRPALAATAAPPQPKRLPAYALYGEPQLPGLPDLLHIETIAARSRVHDWEIKPHRHESLFQILVIASGAVRVQLDGTQQRLQGPCAISVPAMAVHGFRFAPSIDGMVITVAAQPLQAVLGADPAWRDALGRLQALAAAPAALLQAAAVLRDDYHQAKHWRRAALDTGLRRLLLELVRAAPTPADAGPAQAAPRALQHVRRFQALVEAQYRRQPALASLAAQMGITPTQLNRVCHRVLGHAALGVLHGRLLLEAQRELGYTTMSVKQVAIGLGFGDAGYFTRFFQRLAGQTPSAWRAAARQQSPIIRP